MKRRLTIARSLINEPTLLLLDEPTTGLDPQARHLLWDRLYRLKQRGVTLVLTTHYMDEAEQLCDRLVVMDKAQIVAEGSPRELIEQLLDPRRCWSCGSRRTSRRRSTASFDGLADRIERLPDRVLLYTDDGEAAVVAVHERGLRPESVLVRRSHARGRLPAADRPDPDRVGRRDDDGAPAVPRPRVRPAWSTAAVWRGHARSSTFLSPVLFLAAMGIGLGVFVDRRRRAALGGVPLPGLPRARVSSPPGDADGRLRGDLPDHGRASSGAGTYHAMLRHADRGPRHRLRPARPGSRCGCRSWRGHLRGRDRRFGLVALAAGASCAIPVAVLTGLAFADADHGLRRRPRRTTSGFALHLPLRASRRCSCSAARSSRSSSCRARSSRSPGSRRSTTASR